MIRPWQPAFPQAMQRHGGRTRPVVKPAAKAAEAPRKPSSDDDRADADVANPPADATTDVKE